MGAAQRAERKMVCARQSGGMYAGCVFATEEADASVDDLRRSEIQRHSLVDQPMAAVAEFAGGLVSVCGQG